MQVQQLAGRWGRSSCLGSTRGYAQMVYVCGLVVAECRYLAGKSRIVEQERGQYREFLVLLCHELSKLVSVEWRQANLALQFPSLPFPSRLDYKRGANYRPP